MMKNEQKKRDPLNFEHDIHTETDEEIHFAFSDSSIKFNLFVYMKITPSSDFAPFYTFHNDPLAELSLARWVNIEGCQLFVDSFADSSNRFNFFDNPLQINGHKAIPIGMVFDTGINLVPTIIFILVKDEIFLQYLQMNEELIVLLERFITWFDSCEHHLDSYKRIFEILARKIEKMVLEYLVPEYFEIQKLLSLDDVKREMLLMVLKYHRLGGVSINMLKNTLTLPQKEIYKHIDALIAKDLLYIYTKKEQRSEIVDVLWYI